MGKHARDTPARARFVCSEHIAESKMRRQRKTSEWSLRDWTHEVRNSPISWQDIALSSRLSIEGFPNPLKDSQIHGELTPEHGVPDGCPSSRIVPHLPAPNIGRARLPLRKRIGMTASPHNPETRSRYHANHLGHADRLLQGWSGSGK